MTTTASHRAALAFYVETLIEGEALPSPFQEQTVERRCWSDSETLPIELMSKAATLGIPNTKLKTYGSLARALRARREGR